MATITKEGITIQYSGEKGDSVATISAIPNQGAKKSVAFNFRVPNTDIDIPITVNQAKNTEFDFVEYLIPDTDTSYLKLYSSVYASNQHDPSNLKFYAPLVKVYSRVNLAKNTTTAISRAGAGNYIGIQKPLFSASSIRTTVVAATEANPQGEIMYISIPNPSGITDITFSIEGNGATQVTLNVEGVGSVSGNYDDDLTAGSLDAALYSSRVDEDERKIYATTVLDAITNALLARYYPISVNGVGAIYEEVSKAIIYPSEISSFYPPSTFTPGPIIAAAS